MSHAILGTPAAEVRKLQNLVDDGRRLRAQLRRVARARSTRRTRASGRPRARASTRLAPRPAWSRENRALLVSLVVHYYPPDRLAGLPRELLEDAVLANLDVKNLAAMAAVSWRGRRGGPPTTPRGGRSTRGASAPRTTLRSTSTSARLRDAQFRQRLGDPGREMEWRSPGAGASGSRASRSIGGLAWWAARGRREARRGGRGRSRGAPGRSTTGARKYKVHYVHWDARWDEWVARDQLRWPVPGGPHGRRRVGVDVEVWCSGSAVPGASAPASLARHAMRDGAGAHGDSTQVAPGVVAAVEGARCVGDVASSGRLWVRRGPRAPHPAQAGPGAPRAGASNPPGVASRARATTTAAVAPGEPPVYGQSGGHVRQHGGNSPGATRAGPGAQGPRRSTTARARGRTRPSFVPHGDEAVDGRVHLPNQTKFRRGAAGGGRCVWLAAS